MIDETGTEIERAGFCQDCGRPLTRETARLVGSAIFCEPCLQVRVGATAQAPIAQGFTPGTTSGPATDAASGWTTTAGSAPFTAVPTGTIPPGTMPPGTMPPLGGDSPNPALAGFLGLIPGVGAMYNGQFGKAIIHLLIFFLLESMHHVDFFGFLTFLWCLYQAYEAYHTALARRQGRPLPDPFGFNDLAERMGIFQHFHIPNVGPRPAPGAPAPPPPFAATAAGYDTGNTYSAPPPFVPPAQPAAQAVPVYEPVATGYAPNPSTSPYAVPYAPVPMAAVAPSTGLARFPSLAIWLIGLGIVFLLLNLDSARWSVAHTVPFLLAALAVWLFVRRMASTGGVLPIAQADGTSEEFYLNRLVHQLALPGTLLVLSILIALENFHLARWDTLWPILLIAFGGFLLLGRLISKPVVLFPAAPMPPYSAASAPAPGQTDAEKGGR